MSSSCHRKKPFEWYEDALNHVVFTDQYNGRNPLHGSVYVCPECGDYHVSKRRFTLLKRRKGRGKSRRGLVVMGA
jgi:hypothetical protein